MKKIDLILICIVSLVFLTCSTAGIVLVHKNLQEANISTNDIIADNTEGEDDVIFEKPLSPTPTSETTFTTEPTPTDDPSSLPDQTPSPSPTPEPTPTPVPTPTPNPASYYKTPYIASAQKTWAYDKIYKSGKAQQTSNSYNILVLAADWTSGCTDSIIIVNINQDSGQISTLSLPRDCYVKLQNGTNGKINELYSRYGITMLCNYIKGLTGIDINYYIVITGSTIQSLIDAVGGIDYDVPVDIPHLGLSKGVQHLNGTQAVELLRFRNFYYTTDNVTEEQLAAFDGRDINRVKTAIGMMQAFAEQKFTLEHILNVNSYISIVLNNSKTNIKAETVISMINIMLDHYDSITRDNNFNSYLLGGMYNDNKYHNQYGAMWVWEVNDCVVNYNTNKAYFTKGIIEKLFTTKYAGLASY